MSELKGIITTKGNLKSTINSKVKTGGVVSVGGTLISANMAKRGLKGDKGDTGDTGATGNGISSVTFVSSSGLVDTYKITFTNGTETTFGVTNGQDGIDGTDGADGFSPIANVAKVGDTATITITDEGGTTTATITDGTDGQDGHSPSVTASKAGKVTTVYVDGSSIATINDGNDGQDGQDGTDGQDGHSPVVTANKVGKVTTVSVDGSPIATINDGVDGQDGYSPSATVSKAGSVATISITDKDGTTTASVSDGNGVPSGGTSGQVLTKYSSTDYDVSWEDPSGGTITDVTVDGTSIVDDGVAELETVTQLRDGLMVATDKQKLDGIASGAEVNVQSNWSQSDSTADDFIKNKPTIPTKVSDLSNDSGFITTETDPTVPSWAKQASKPSYTFSEIGSKPTTISGYGITDAKISSGTITLGSNSITPLTSFTETDPIFTASPAHGISSTDISNWNGKSDFSGSYNDLTDKPAIHNVPSGGTTNQVLAKNSNTDYDLKWTSAGGGGGTLVQLVRW